MTESQLKRNRIVEENMGLVHSIARRFLGRGYDYEELRQIGAIGLIKAVDRFDESYGGRLSTYAVPVIMGEIKRFLRDDGPVKVSRSLKELSATAMAKKENMENTLGREVTLSELAREIGADEEMLVTALGAAYPVKSLYEETDKDSGLYLVDTVSDDDKAEDELIDKMALSEAMKNLDKREQNVIIMRYFRSMTQDKTAQCMGVSQVQVSRIEAQAKKKIKEYMAERI